MLTSRAVPFRAALAVSALFTLLFTPPRVPAQTAPAAAIAETQILSLQPQDTFLNLDDTNYSTDNVLATYTWPDKQVANAILMKFDLAALPVGAVVEEATLHLALVDSDATADSTYTVTAHKVLGRSPVIAKATGNTLDGATPWSPNECCFGSVPLAQADISPAYDTRAIDRTPGYKAWTLTPMIQEWLADPATNFGLLLNSDASKLGDRYRFFASSEHPDVLSRPVLRIAYKLPSSRLVLSPQDTFLNINSRNYSTTAQLATYTWPDRRVANTILMKFDLSSLPREATVQEATLRLALVDSDATADGSYTVTAHKVMGKNPAIAKATGYTIDGVTAWTANANCYNNVPLAQADVSPAYDARAIDKVRGYKAWTLTRMVQEWLADPATNFGLLLNSDTSKLRDRYRVFASMEHPDTTFRPVLSVAYTLPTSDTTPPSVSITGPAAGASVSGSITVTASASDDVGVASVQFQLDGADLGLTDTASPYSVSWNTAGVANGSHTLTAVARDASGNVTTSAGVTVTVTNDQAAPSVSITSPSGGSTVSGTITVAASATDNVGVVGVQFKRDGVNLGAEDTTSPYSVSWNTTNVANGSHTLTAVARDAAGNLTTSTVVTVTVANDKTAPAVSITSPSGGSTVSGTITVGASATDNVGVVGVQFKRNGVNLGAEDTTSPYSVSWNTTAVANGSYTLTAVARDAAGNVTTSAAVAVTVANSDTTPPSASVTAPAAGASVSGTITVTASASDNVGVAGVQFKLDGANLGAEDTTSPYSVSWNTTTAVNGSHTLTAVARDAAGNLTTSAAVTVTAANDKTAPSVSITAPAAGASVSGTITVTSGASDNVGVAGVQFKLDGANLGAEDTTSPYSVSWDTTKAANGSHTLTAVARDAAGNVATSAGVTVTVSNTAPGAGLAALYPGDLGIETNPNVVFVERFDESTLTNLFGRWADILNGSAMSFSTDAPAGSPVGRSLNIPWSSASDGGHLYRQLSPGVDDTLYVRYYVKYPASGSYQHEGVWMGGSNPALAWPNPQAGVKPTGSDRFSAAAEQSDDLSRFDHYNYWMDMRQSPDGKYWGNTLLNNQNVKGTPGQWMCVEHMVKLNSPVTASNGESAIWINGVKVSHLGQGFPNGSWTWGNFTQDPSGTPFGGIRWRSTTSLNLNWLWLQVYAPGGGSGSIKYAHVVAAKSYVGCLAAGPSPSDTTPPTASLTSPAGGATVSGTVTVSGNASDNVGVAGVQFKLDGANLGAEDTTSPYSVSWDTTKTANGSHTLTAVARDAAGNQATSSALTVTVSNGSSGSGIVFESSWDTATGTSSAAVTDGGRWPNYWEFNNGSNVQLLSAVSGGVNGHNALRVQQRGSTYAANVQIDNFLPPSTDYYLRYYMRNDDTSGSGDHIATVDTWNYSNLTFMRKYGSSSSWRFVASMYGCGFTYPISHWGPAQALANGQWYRFEYHVDFVASNRVQVHPRVYDAAGNLLFSDKDFQQEDYGSASWNGRSDWTLDSYYAAGNSFCVDPSWVNDFGLGNNGQYGAADTGRYWYFSGVQIRTDTWPGAASSDISAHSGASAPETAMAAFGSGDAGLPGGPAAILGDTLDGAAFAGLVRRWPDALDRSAAFVGSGAEPGARSRSLDLPWVGDAAYGRRLQTATLRRSLLGSEPGGGSLDPPPLARLDGREWRPRARSAGLSRT